MKTNMGNRPTNRAMAQVKISQFIGTTDASRSIFHRHLGAGSKLE